MPYTGFTGEAADSLYYRKHNPLVSKSHLLSFLETHDAQVSFQSVAANETRMAHIKNLSMFYTDLDNDSLPQVSVLNHFLEWVLTSFLVDVHISKYQQ